MKLKDVVKSLNFLDADATIYAVDADPESEACVAFEPDDGSLPGEATDMRYLLEVFLAKDVIDAWIERHGRSPSDEEAVNAVIYYAENDAYPP